MKKGEGTCTVSPTWGKVMPGHEFYKQIPGVDTYRQNIAVLGGSLYKYSSDTRGNFTGLLLHFVLLPHPHTS